MGDCNAVSFGQASHIGLILASEAITVHQLLTLRGRVPRSPLMLGVVIDDLVVLEKLARGIPCSTIHCHSARVMACLRAAYASAHLPTHDKKAFYLAQDASFWGAEVFGELGSVRPSWTRLVPLAFLTLAAASLPAISVPLLETLAGSWVATLPFRRRSLCLLREVYRLQRNQARDSLVEVTCLLRREFLVLCVLAPLLRTDLRAQTSGFLVASDASDNLGAFCFCLCSPAARPRADTHL